MAMKVLAISGSLREDSFEGALIMPQPQVLIGPVHTAAKLEG